MKKIKYILLFIIGIVLLNSCEEVIKEVELIGDGDNLIVFELSKTNIGGLADGSEYINDVQIKLTGPSMTEIKDDIVVTLKASSTSTAIAGQHYRIENPTITLTASNNYLGIIDLVLMTEGNTPPMDGTPELDDYVAPVLNLEIETATGNSKVVASGKPFVITLNYTPPNPYAGDYDVEMRYFHPTAGGSHPSQPDFDPDDPYGGIRNYEKTLAAVTGRKCETEFSVWTDLCWITINADNSIAYVVDDTWTYDVSLGNPFDPSQVSHFDPATGVIYMYYYYTGTGGDRIFWEVFTPKFK